jgi:hypothetical protein
VTVVRFCGLLPLIAGECAKIAPFSVNVSILLFLFTSGCQLVVEAGRLDQYIEKGFRVSIIQARSLPEDELILP